jgi:hypothetical protein
VTAGRRISAALFAIAIDAVRRCGGIKRHSGRRLVAVSNFLREITVGHPIVAELRAAVLAAKRG